MEIIITTHAKKRMIERGVPFPDCGIKKATLNFLKQNNLIRRLNNGKCGYVKLEKYDYYFYICMEREKELIIITAYKFKNIFNKTGNRKIK
jgi:hypothetical protein